MKQIKELRIDAKLFAGGAAGFAIPEFIDNAKDAAENVVTASLWCFKMKQPGAKEYAEKYKKALRRLPILSRSLAYSALYVVKDALERAKSWTPDAIRDALKATNVSTAFGPIKFENKEGYQNQNFMETIVLQVVKASMNAYISR